MYDTDFVEMERFWADWSQNEETEAGALYYDKIATSNVIGGYIETDPYFLGFKCGPVDDP